MGRDRPSRKAPRLDHGLGRFTGAALVFAVCLFAYLANGRTLPFGKGGDTIPNRLLPLSLLGYGTLTLDPFAERLERGGQHPWYLVRSRGHLVSFYPIGPALAAIPIYSPAWAWMSLNGSADAAHFFDAAETLEKISASIIAALGAALLYGTLRRLASPPGAMGIALAFGLATSMWATASQLLWQHGTVVLGLVLAIFLLSREEVRQRELVGAGLALALAVASRPTAALFAAAVVAAAWWRPPSGWTRAQAAAWLAVGAAPICAIVLAYDLVWFSSVLGGYRSMAGNIAWRTLPTGLAGLLVSPNRGLLIFTPIAVLGIWGCVSSFREIRHAPLLPLLTVAAAAHLLISAAYVEWPGGYSFGPRYLVDLLPVLALGAALAVPRLPRTLAILAVLGAAWSLWVQWNGAFCYPASRWDDRMVGTTASAVFDWRHFELFEDYSAWSRGGPRAAPR